MTETQQLINEWMLNMIEELELNLKRLWSTPSSTDLVANDVYDYHPLELISVNDMKAQ